MNPKDIRKLGKLAYHQCMYPIEKSPIRKRFLIVGFDTEYDSHTRELLSLQFSHKEKTQFIEWPNDAILTWEILENLVTDFLLSLHVPINKRHCSGIKLPVYWSVAESQHISDLQRAKIFETSVGSDFTYVGKGKRTLEIIDVMKFFNNPAQPLAKVAAAFGYKKEEYDTTNVTRETLKDPKFRYYAEQDAVNIEGIFRDLRDAYLKPYQVDILHTKTPASTSSAIFRLHYLENPCEQPDTRLRRLALLAAWGGRNEAFRRGIIPGPIYEYDAFSEYPNSAIQLKSLPLADSWIPATSLDPVLENHGIAQVRFEFPAECDYPCLPVFAQSKLFYPLSGETFCTNAEIQLAHDLGAKIDLVEGYYYRSGTEALARYMADFLEQRSKAKSEDDKIQSHVIKLAINSLIGKFIQRVTKTDLNILNDLYLKTDIPVHMLRKLDEISLREMCEEFDVEFDEIERVSVGNAFYPEWNTLILGYARASTSRFLLRVANDGFRPLLCSTDSVIFQSENGEKPIDEYTENGIRFDGRATAQRAAVVRTRLYRLSNPTKTIKLAHHAVARRIHAQNLFAAWENDQKIERMVYDLTRIRTYRESISYGYEYGSEAQLQRSASLAWDRKRDLLPGGYTRPWQEVPKK